MTFIENLTNSKLKRNRGHDRPLDTPPGEKDRCCRRNNATSAESGETRRLVRDNDREKAIGTRARRRPSAYRGANVRKPWKRMRIAIESRRDYEARLGSRGW